MTYHIFANGNLIASFYEEADRDVCLDALAEYWGRDIAFTTE